MLGSPDFIQIDFSRVDFSLENGDRNEVGSNIPLASGDSDGPGVGFSVYDKMMLIFI